MAAKSPGVDVAIAKQLAKLVGELTLATATAEDRADMAETQRALKRKPVGSVEVAGELVLIDFQDSGVFIVKPGGAVHKVKMYGVPGRVAYPTLAAAITDHEAKLRTVRSGGELEPEPSEHGWRIETARTGRSTCRVCSRGITEGELRFGQDAKTATWFHLACAAEGAPRAFKPFAAKAATLAAPAKAASAKAGKQTAGAKDRDKIIAELRAHPGDGDVQQVFADWLQASGDPWGELIALERAGKTKDAAALFKAHAADLTGGFGSRLLYWRDGFLEAAYLEGKQARSVAAQVAELAALRTAVVLSELALDVRPDAALCAAISKHAPPTLRHLRLNGGPGLEALALPHLTSLHVQLREPPKRIDGLLRAELRALRTLSVHGTAGGSGSLGTTAVLPADFVAALLGSKLVARLAFLELDFGALDAAGAQIVVDAQKSLRHLEGLGVGVGRAAPKLVSRQAVANDRRWEADIAHAEGRRQYA